MLILVVDQGAIPIFDDAIDLDLAGDHLCGLQAAVGEGVDHPREIFLEISEDYIS